MLGFLVMLEADCFDDDRVSKCSDRNPNHLRLQFSSLNGHCWFPVAPLVRGCNLCNPPVLPCPGKAKLGEDHPETLKSLNNLAFLFQAQGHLAEAEPLFREALEKSVGAQLQRFQWDFGHWIWSHTFLDIRYLGLSAALGISLAFLKPTSSQSRVHSKVSHGKCIVNSKVP